MGNKGLHGFTLKSCGLGCPRGLVEFAFRECQATERAILEIARRQCQLGGMKLFDIRGSVVSEEVAENLERDFFPKAKVKSDSCSPDFGLSYPDSDDDNDYLGDKSESDHQSGQLLRLCSKARQQALANKAENKSKQHPDRRPMGQTAMFEYESNFKCENDDEEGKNDDEYFFSAHW